MKNEYLQSIMEIKFLVYCLYNKRALNGLQTLQTVNFPHLFTLNLQSGSIWNYFFVKTIQQSVEGIID